MKVKNQHYVPRFYLKYFTFNKNQIWVYDKSNRRKYISSLENVACENYFYDNNKIDEYLESLKKVYEYSDNEIKEIKKEIMQLEEYEIKDLDEDGLTTYVTTINKEVA